jgi:hypothetical protein
MRAGDILIEGPNSGDGLVLRTELLRDLLHNRVGAINVVLVRLPFWKGHSLAGVIEPALSRMTIQRGGTSSGSGIPRTHSGSLGRRASR